MQAPVLDDVRLQAGAKMQFMEGQLAPTIAMLPDQHLKAVQAVGTWQKGHAY